MVLTLTLWSKRSHNTRYLHASDAAPCTTPTSCREQALDEHWLLCVISQVPTYQLPGEFFVLLLELKEAFLIGSGGERIQLVTGRRLAGQVFQYGHVRQHAVFAERKTDKRKVLSRKRCVWRGRGRLLKVTNHCPYILKEDSLQNCMWMRARVNHPPICNLHI